MTIDLPSVVRSAGARAWGSCSSTRPSPRDSLSRRAGSRAACSPTFDPICGPQEHRDRDHGATDHQVPAQVRISRQGEAAAAVVLEQDGGADAVAVPGPPVELVGRALIGPAVRDARPCSRCCPPKSRFRAGGRSATWVLRRSKAACAVAASISSGRGQWQNPPGSPGVGGSAASLLRALAPLGALPTVLPRSRPGFGGREG